MSPDYHQPPPSSIYLDLLNIGVPEVIIAEIQRSGIFHLRKMQKDSLEKGLLDGESFLLISPSGSGKTLIGELAAVTKTYQSNQKALYLVPLRALAFEKYNDFSQKYQNLNINTLMVVGDQDVSNLELNSANILIMTYEKFDAFLRKGVMVDWITSIVAIIVDEVHIIGDSHRGPRLESLIIRMYQLKLDVQFLFLSATIGNPKYIFKWLNYLEQKYHKRNLQYISNQVRPIKLNYKVFATKQKFDVIEKISHKTLNENGQVLIFVNSRIKTETFAKMLASRMIIYKNKAERKWVNSFVKEIQTISRFLDHSLNSDYIADISTGIGYHHAGLSYFERRIVEKAFLEQKIKIIFTTTSLSAGINLPARTVILHESFLFHRNEQTKQLPAAYTKYIKKPMDRNLFHQISGRAGRPGYDNEGNVYILTNSQQEKEKIYEYYFTKDKQEEINPQYDKIISQIPNNQELLLETVLLSIQKSSQFKILDLLEFLQDSLIASDLAQHNIPINNYLNLFHSDLISLYKFFSSPIIRYISKIAHISIQIKEISPKKIISGSISIRILRSDIKKDEIVPNTLDLIYKHSQISEHSYEDESVIEWGNNFTFSCLSSNNCSCSYQISRDPIPIISSLQKYPVNPLCLDQILVLFAFLQDHSLSSFSSEKINILIPSEQERLVSLMGDLDTFFHKAIYPPTIVEQLQKFQLITAENGDIDNISCTLAGEIALNCYINPSLASNYNNLAIQFLQSKERKLTIPFVIKTVIQTHIDSNDNLPDNAFDLLLDWINEIPLDLLREKHTVENSFSNLSNIDLGKFFDKFSHNFKFFSEYFKKNANNTIFPFFRDIYWRIKWGIKEDLLHWAHHFTSIDIRIFRSLTGKKRINPQKFLLMNNRELSELMNISIKEILIIKQNYRP